MSRALPVLNDDSEKTAPEARGEDHHQTKGLLRLTMACNERCVFCNVPVEDYRPVTPSRAALAAELDAFIASGEQTLTISGGEPTLMRDRLIDVVTKARGAGVPFVELQTNAVLIDDDYAQALATAGVTSAFVSFLSHVPELHDQLAGLEGAYPDCLRGMDALMDAGIAVTLNPVTAFSTQHLVGDYVAFVAQRLPRVRAISLSAVQPHGRAKDNAQLLPDYGILKGQVVLAQERANAADIRLLNPYCGLPLCVGWHESAERSVEAIEAIEHREQQAFGVEAFANAIPSYSNGGEFKPINAKASTQDGLNPSTTILDEIHAHKTHDLLNVLRSAAGARSNPLFLFTILKMHTVGQKYVTTWGYVADPLIFVVNKDIWNSWTPADQKIVREAAIEAGKQEIAIARKGLVEADKPLLKDIAAMGVTVTALTPAEREAFVKATRPVYDKWKATIGPDLVKTAEAAIAARKK